ncbi:MAG: hypothetical protein WCK47_14750 [bacterium]
MMGCELKTQDALTGGLEYNVENSQARRGLRVWLVLAVLIALISACGRQTDPAKAAKEFLRKNAPAQQTGISASSALGSERYLRSDERLRRRQQRIIDVLAAQPAAPAPAPVPAARNPSGQ